MRYYIIEKYGDGTRSYFCGKAKDGYYQMTGRREKATVFDFDYAEKICKENYEFSMIPAEECVCCGSTNDFLLINRETCRNSGVEISINRRGMLRFRYYPPMMDGSGSFVPVFETQEIINLKFCPFCGRKFE